MLAHLKKSSQSVSRNMDLRDASASKNLTVPTDKNVGVFCFEIQLFFWTKNLVRWLAPGHGGRGATFRLVQIFTGGEIKAASTSLPLISILMVAWHRR